MLQEFDTLTLPESSSTSQDIQQQLPIKISAQDLIEIVERASTIGDRLGREFVSRVSEKEQKIIEARLEQWCQKEKAIDYSGLGNSDEELSVRSLIWQSVNTDNMATIEEEIA